MIGPTGLAAGPLYTQAVMGQFPSATEREHVRKASTTIFREDCIRVEESESVSRPDSDYSIHWDDTTQPPYVQETEGKMMTQNSLLTLPVKNASYKLALFLKTTGPIAPHRRPSKVERARRTYANPKAALRFLKTKQWRSTASTASPEG